MKKIYIIGIVASGKTTLAKRLSRELNIQHYEVDCIAYKVTAKGRVKRDLEAQIAEFESIDQASSWIIEGTYRPSCECLFSKADCIVFLDPPLWLRKMRIVMRFIKQQLGLEPSHYKSDVNMLKWMFKWTNDFEKNRSSFEKKLEQYGQKVIFVRNERDIQSLFS